MRALPQLFENNRKWADGITSADPEFFLRLARRQAPEFLWIGCADSRVPANEIVGLQPGELFVHRNVANLVMNSDMNCLSVIQYAVDFLKVKHILVCGHYGCGGIAAALDGQRHGLVDNWLAQIRGLYRLNAAELDSIPSKSLRLRRLCELNVVSQVVNVASSTVVQDAWKRGEKLAIHGWIYDLSDGHLKDLSACVISPDDLALLQSSFKLASPF